MHVTNIRTEQDDSKTTLIADVYPDFQQDHFNLWLKVDNQFANFLSATGEVFLAALLIECMWQEQSLEIDGEISTKLMSHLDELMTYHQIGNPQLSKISIKAKTVVRSTVGEQVGLFFSGGVDSFFTFLKNQEQYKDQPENQIKYFFLIRGFDIALEESQDELWDTTVKNITDVAKHFSVTLICVETNFRQLNRAPADWKMKGMKELWADSLFGSLLCAVGLAFASAFKTFYISSAATYTSLRPWASHPLIDPLWSTEQLDFIHYGCHASRMDKLKTVKNSKLALHYLRVCWENPKNEYNCGTCEKCLRTMLPLEIWGMLTESRTFSHKIDNSTLTSVLNRLPLQKNQLIKLMWKEILSEAEEYGRNDYAEQIRSVLFEKNVEPQKLMMEMKELQQELSRTYRSISWRLTKPLRLLSAQLRLKKIYAWFAKKAVQS